MFERQTGPLLLRLLLVGAAMGRTNEERLELLRLRQTKHGMSRLPEYATWTWMITRCTNPKTKAFARYGGRGISVCERWRTFPPFFDDMGQRPSPKHSLDRIDNNKGYEPGNCRWATRREQSRNKAKTRMLTVNGVARPLADWADSVGLPHSTIRTRLALGWTPEAAVHAPLLRRGKARKAT